MNKPIFVSGFLLLIGIASAQYQPLVKINPLHLDTSLVQKSPKNIMPNALALVEVNKMQILKGNNGEGFNLFESNLDGMTIVSPDKSQSYSIPNALQKKQLFLITNPSDVNTGNFQIRIPQPFTDTMYIPPFNTKKFNPIAGFKK